MIVIIIALQVARSIGYKSLRRDRNSFAQRYEYARKIWTSSLAPSSNKQTNHS